MRVVHVITDLQTGGAQTMLRQVAGRLQAMGVENTVVSLSRPDPSRDSRPGLGLPQHDLNMTPGVPGLGGFVRLTRLLRALRPDVVHTWMYHADLVGGLAAALTGTRPVIWGIHHTPGRSGPLKPRTRIVVRANALLSHVVPARIVCCAHASREAHEALGFARRRMRVVPNGFDTERFRPDPEARTAVREEMGLGAEARLVGLAGRFHPHKDHRTFVTAAARLMPGSPDVHFMLAGAGVDDANPVLRTWTETTGAPDRFHLLGRRDDMPRLMAACDLVTSSSSAEALPLVLGEAMACAVPCVATDVGDSARLVGDTGRVVRPGDPEALAAAWRALLDLPPGERRLLGERARQRVLDEYQLTACVEAYLALYREVRPAAAGGPYG